MGKGTCNVLGVIGVRRERGIHGDPNDVLAGRHGILPVPAVEHEILAADVLAVRVGPPDADPLVARCGPRATCAVGPRSPSVCYGVRVAHAEAPLRGAPELAGRGIYKL